MLEKCRIELLCATLLGWQAAAQAQWPFNSPTPAASATPFNGFAKSQISDEPAREIPLVEKKWGELSPSSRNISILGGQAIAIAPEKWRHAETENFVLHYRRVTEAQKVAREVEYDLWFVARSLGAKKEQYQKRSHVFIFEDEAEWKTFLAGIPNQPQWSASFARGDELYLNVRRTEAVGQFDSHLLAHETTHAVVARLYPQSRWPLWLNEGLAEYMGGASVAARKNQTVKRHERTLSYAQLSLDQLTQMKVYPQDPVQVAQLYETSEKLLRFLMTELPADRITKFIDAVLAGNTLQTAILNVYGDQFKDFDAFSKRYERFSK